MSLDTLVHDGSAVVALLMLVVTSVGAILSALEKESPSRKRVFVALSLFGLVVGSVAVWQQHLSSQRASAQMNALRLNVIGAEAKLADLARLNEVSPSTRYHVRLSVDGRKDEPCEIQKKVLGLFPEAISRGEIRLIYREDPDPSQPYHLIFGKQLSLSSAEIFQRFAVAHSLSNGFPPIEREREEKPVSCP